MIRGLFAKARAEAAFLVLLAVACVGCWFYVHYRQVVADRNDLLHRAEIICARAGQDFNASPAAPRGKLCAAKVGGLAAFLTDTNRQTAKILADAMAAHDARQLTDNQAARDAAEAARSAAQRMEIADAQAERRNLVDREWFSAVNGVAGLRPQAAP
jgi:hypothetical protein